MKIAGAVEKISASTPLFWAAGAVVLPAPGARSPMARRRRRRFSAGTVVPVQYPRPVIVLAGGRPWYGTTLALAQLHGEKATCPVLT
jgi:hypothetical protein